MHAPQAAYVNLRVLCGGMSCCAVCHMYVSQVSPLTCAAALFDLCVGRLARLAVRDRETGRMGLPQARDIYTLTHTHTPVPVCVRGQHSMYSSFVCTRYVCQGCVSQSALQSIQTGDSPVCLCLCVCVCVHRTLLRVCVVLRCGGTRVRWQQRSPQP